MKSKLWEVGKELLTVFELVKDNDIIITGSNANMLSGELATLLSGRYIEFQIFHFLSRSF
jgi:predicted AAA+ superfamily ATPase